MKTSVAMCTYNGEKFLKEQLDSILGQTVPVDEIVVCDDGSTDSTVGIVREYEKKFPGIFRIFINENNLRSVKNFERAISLCQNEVIFLSDQDDVWLPEKVKEVLNFFENNKKIQVVATEGYGIDEDSKTLDVFTIWEVPRRLKERSQEFNYNDYISFVSNIATGASMAFRKNFANRIMPFPQIPGYHHDEWIAFMASESNAFEMLPKKLFKYRKHSEQQVGGVFYKKNGKKITRMLRLSDFKKNADEKDFFYYKTILKRLALSYKKFGKLAESDSRYHKIFNQKKEESKKLFDKNLQEVTQRYPLQYRILSFFDAKKGKRKI